MTWTLAPLKQIHYGLILMDPPWEYETYSEKGQAKSASQHYEVMSLEELKALPVHMLPADDCLLVMWTTTTHLDQSLELMRAYGFVYVAIGAWAKRTETNRKWAFGTGYYMRSAAEFFILGKMGSPKPAVRDVRNLIVAPLREHSRKPDEMHENLERMFPHVPRCELFSRRNRAGWDHWGLETGKLDDSNTEDPAGKARSLPQDVVSVGA